MSTKKSLPAQASRATTRTKDLRKLDENNNSVIISNFAPGFNDQVAKNIITNLYQIYFREHGQENIEINVYNKDGELIV
ncbi:MAG: hypothetical protein MR545_08640 [Veillonellaceae bacterium]|nr:hypothetical protein [Veillonellaceae bacterium]